MNTAKTMLTILLTTVLSGALFAAVTPSASSVMLAIDDPGPAALGLGGTAPAALSGADAVTANPAGIALADGFQLQAFDCMGAWMAHNIMLAAAIPVGKFNLGAQFGYYSFGLGNLDLTADEIGIFGANWATNAGVTLEDGLVSEILIGLGAGFNFDQIKKGKRGPFSMGILVKILMSDITQTDGGTGVAADIGILYASKAIKSVKKEDSLFLGVAVQNLGTISYGDYGGALPFNARGALALVPKVTKQMRLLLGVGANYGYEGFAGGLGLQVTIQQMFALRAGYYYAPGNAGGLTMGLGFTKTPVRIDVGAMIGSILGGQNKISIGLGIAMGKKKPSARAEEEEELEATEEEGEEEEGEEEIGEEEGEEEGLDEELDSELDEELDLE
jgi:hypothetical protein